MDRLTPSLSQYLRFERAMTALDKEGSQAGDEVRDAMDEVWLLLSEDERAWINSRQLPPA